MRNENSRRDYLASIASHYYDQNKNQQEIADEFGITRSAVSRLLAEARARGVVEIIVHVRWRTSPELENALVQEFGLKSARVLVREKKTYEMMLKGLGELAAECFTDLLTRDLKVGISWGTALRQLVISLPSGQYSAAEVIQLIGATGTERSSLDGPLLAPLLANTLNCKCRFLHAPLIMESEAGLNVIMQERSIRETLGEARNVDIALVGIGSTNPEIYNPYRLGYVTDDELHELHHSGAIGLVCARHFDVYGQVLDIPVNRRVVGISLEELHKIPYVIGVAGDAVKGEAILGALCGRHVNVLITDDTAARRVLELHRAVSTGSKIDSLSP